MRQYRSLGIFSVGVLLVNVFSLHQMTALDVAAKRGHKDIENILRGAGMSNVSAVTADLSLRYS